MDIQLTKLELIKMLLNTDEISVLAKIKALLETEQTGASLTEEEYRLIDKRRENYLNGKGKSLSWEHVKEKALKDIS